MKARARIPWPRLRADYESGLITADTELARRYGCSPATIKARRDEDRRRGNPWTQGVGNTAPRDVDAAPSGPAEYVPHRAANLEPVPDATLKLPWTRYPRDPDTARAIAAQMEHGAKSALIANLGPEAVAYFETQAQYLRAIAGQNERRDPEGGKVEHAGRRRVPGVFGIA